MNLRDTHDKPRFAGRAFRIDYDGLSAHNVYAADGQSVRYAIVSGPYAGVSGESPCQWRQLVDGATARPWR